MQFELTGEEDEGSHTTLATALANVQGTQLALRPSPRSWQQHEPQLLARHRPASRPWPLVIAAYDHLGTWTPLDGSPTRQREQLDSAVSSLLEQLSSFPICSSCPVQPATADS